MSDEVENGDLRETAAGTLYCVLNVADLPRRFDAHSAWVKLYIIDVHANSMYSAPDIVWWSKRVCEEDELISRM